MEKIIRSICIGADKMLAGTGYSFVFVLWKTDAPIIDTNVGIGAHPNIAKDQAADACGYVQKKLQSRIIH